MKKIFLLLSIPVLLLAAGLYSQTRFEGSEQTDTTETQTTNQAPADQLIEQQQTDVPDDTVNTSTQSNSTESADLQEESKQTPSENGVICGKVILNAGAAEYDESGGVSTLLQIYSLPSEVYLTEQTSQDDGSFSIDVPFGKYRIVVSEYGTTRDVEASSEVCAPVTIMIGLPSSAN